MTIQNPTSVQLFHGPNAEDAALEAAEAYGKILAVLGSEKGVRKDDARKMVALHNAPPASDSFGVVVLGPMDLATIEASDALLKVVEEPCVYVKPFLWAKDLGEVSKTIRSRCHAVWSYGQASQYDVEIAEDLIDQAIEGCGISAAELLSKHTPKEALDAIIDRLSKKGIPPRTWSLYKATLGNESISSVAAVLMGGK